MTWHVELWRVERERVGWSPRGTRNDTTDTVSGPGARCPLLNSKQCQMMTCSEMTGYIKWDPNSTHESSAVEQPRNSDPENITREPWIGTRNVDLEPRAAR